MTQISGITSKNNAAKFRRNDNNYNLPNLSSVQNSSMKRKFVRFTKLINLQTNLLTFNWIALKIVFCFLIYW